MIYRSLATLFLLLTVFLPKATRAQDVPLSLEMPLPESVDYAEDIPRPEAVIGHVIGTSHTTPAEVVRYFHAVDDASKRLFVEQHGATYEGRPIIHAVVTSPENHARLEEIRQANLALSQRPESVSDSELTRLPAVVYMGYSIHGDEASGTEAALLLLYHLAAGEGPAIEQILQNTVILIDPMFNPDGRDRFVDWVNRRRGAVATADPQDSEHRQPWPGGRTNHYWFDLNRDWLPAQHPVSQGRLELFHHWRPQVLTDFHEMGSNSTYFFQPGIPSRTNPLTPERNQELTAAIAEYHGRALDRIGTLYYTRESYDDFYYGKGSTYPDINGAVGILFEQSSSEGLKIETDRGVKHYAATVRNQFATSLSTLRAVQDLREELLRYQRNFYVGADEYAEDSPVKGYVISLEENRTRAQALAQLLRRHRIRLYALDEPVTVGGESFDEAYVVPVNQPQARLITALMERRTTFPDSLFYDVSTWTLPLAFNVEYAEMERSPAPYLGREIETVEFDGGAVVGSSSLAYIMPWGRYFAPRALYRLQDARIRTQLMVDPFTAIVGGVEKDFGRGSIVISLHQEDMSPDEVRSILQEAAAKDHVRFYGIDSGLTPAGPDLGSRSSSILEKPVVALVIGEGVSSYDAGEVWHLLSERFQIPVSLLDVTDLDRFDLDRYNTLVMVSGSYGDAPADKIKEWVREGGSLIALGYGASWAIENEFMDLTAREHPDLDSLFSDLPYDKLSRAYGAQYIGGTIFEADIDATHPLAFGYDEPIPVFRDNRLFYNPAAEPGANVLVYTEEPLLSGYVSEEMLELAKGTAAMATSSYGDGQIVLFFDNPNFRAFWYGTNGLFLNSIFFSRAL